ncbi:hypothetical protein ACHQM5_014574 [Ranunculus cassubicifolius]
MSLISQNALRKKKQVDVEDVKITEQPSPEETEETEPSLVKSKSKKKREKVHIEEDQEEEGEKKKRKKMHKEDKKRVEEEEKEMKQHESFLFGSLYTPSGFEGEDQDHSALFYTDRNANGVVTVNQEESEDLNDDLDEIREPAWVDEEEEKVLVNIAKRNRLRKLRIEEDEKSISGLDYESRSRAQFAKLNPGTEWAQLGSKWTPDSENESDDEENTARENILRTNEDLVVKSSVKLLPGLLEYSRLVDANAKEPSDSPINSVQFHRNGQLLLTAGLDKRLKFFQIDGKRNSKIDSLFLEDYPIFKAAFLPDGSQVIVSGRRKFFYTFDLGNKSFDKIGPLVGRDERSYESFEVSPDSKTIAFLGNEGYILLVSTKTKELIGTMKMNGNVRSMAYTDDGNQLITSGGDGHIYHWDLRTRTCFHKGVDEGCIMGTSLGASPNGSLFAAGSSSGIVNVYNREEFLGGKRKPVKSIENLTTKVDLVKFNHDAQIMAICSTMQKNSLKLVHVPTFSVFSNWPPPKMTLHHPRCLDFSPGGGFMAMGNAAGKVFLYKLHHYQHA